MKFLLLLITILPIHSIFASTFFEQFSGQYQLVKSSHGLSPCMEKLSIKKTGESEISLYGLKNMEDINEYGIWNALTGNPDPSRGIDLVLTQGAYRNKKAKASEVFYSYTSHNNKNSIVKNTAVVFKSWPHNHRKLANFEQTLTLDGEQLSFKIEGNSLQAQTCLYHRN